MKKVGVFFLVVVSFFCISIPSAESQTTGRTNITVTPPATEINDVAPGKTFNLVVKLKNNGTVTGSWYTEKSLFTIENGEQKFIPNSENEDIAGWITVEPGPISVQPAETITVEVAIAVPANATSGVHHGAIFFSESKPGTNPSAAKLGSLFILRVLGGSRDTNIDFNQEEKSNHFISSEPAAGSTTDFPTRVTLTFDTNLSDQSTISVVDSSNVEYSFGEIKISNGTEMSRRMKATAPDGLYTVQYSGCVAGGTCETGSFQFEVKAGTYLPPAQGPNWILIVGSIGAAALIALIIVIIIHVRNNRKSRGVQTGL